MKKKCLLFVLIIAVLFSFQAVSAEVDYTKEADMLKDLGLFNGTQKGYELDRVPTRVEAAAMLVRLLGAEDEAKEMKYNHPFTDVPKWADNIVGYMYEKGYTKGISEKSFGSNQTTIARDYTTFMLRSLGYSSSSDFNYTEALEFASSKGIITTDEATNLNKESFKRNEMVMLSYRTINTDLNGEKEKLLNKLYNNGAINKEEAFKQGLVKSYETVITNIDSSTEKLQVISPVINIYAEKNKIKNGSITGFDLERKEYFTDGYSGNICFKKGLYNEEGLNIKYELSFYNKDKFVKKMNYMVYRYHGKDSNNEFITPDDEFDEIRIVSYPLEAEIAENDLEGIFEIITTKDSKLLKEEILKYGNVHATSVDDDRIDFDSMDDINIIAWRAIFNRISNYADGSAFRPNTNKYIVDENFTLVFDTEGSYIDSKKIISLPKNDFKERLNFILIYDEGFNIEKAFLVK